MSGSHLSKDFFDLVKSIGESKSKQEEDRIIVQEVGVLKKRMHDTNPPNKKRQQEFLIRLMYVEMLGHDASFGYIKSVELTASTNLLQKRVGYLCCSLVLSPDHEFRFMIINQLQRDLQSSNHLEVCSALMAVCKLVTAEMVPAILPMVENLLRHETELVRKKAVMALHRFHQINPESVHHLGDKFRRTLCDKDPSVMGAALCILHDLAQKSPGEYKDLVPSYVSILKQITEHRLPREFDYHRIPAPWIQIRLLKILALLGQADQQTSEGMYEVLHDVMRRADTGINVGYAIIYECVRTVTTIYPNSTLLDSAAASISRFISSDNHNLKYLGVTGLAAIVKDHPRYAAAHQMAVIDCLEDPDETLKRKTLDLLYRMTNPVNVEFISDKLTQFLREATDVFLRTELVSRITQCAERYAPSNAWYIQTMTNVFELGGDLVRSEVAHNLLRLIAEGSGEDDEQDMDLRRDAVETYLELLDKALLPDILVSVMAWVLGEYGYLSTTMSLDEICERLCELAERPFQDMDTTRGYILTAITKITAQIGHTSSTADLLMRVYSESRSTDLQQRCFEYLALTKTLSLMQEVLPVDASCEDVEVDPNLDFLTSFVQQAEARGAPRYNPPDSSDDEEEGSRRSSGLDGNGLNFQAYKKPELPYNSTTYKEPITDSSQPAARWGATATSSNAAASNRWGNTNTLPTTSTPTPDAPGYPPPKKVVKNVWGPMGMNANPDKVMENKTLAPTPPQQQLAQQRASSYIPTMANEEPHPQYEEEEVEAPLSERQMMASALFRGVHGGSPAPTASSQKPKPSRRVSTSNITSSKKPSSRSSMQQPPSRKSSRPDRPDRPDASYSQTTSSAPAPTQPPPATVDLLDISFDAPVASVAPYSADPFASSVAPSPSSVRLDPFASGSRGASSSTSSGGDAYSFNGRSLAPMKISTAEFGSRWGTCTCERKVQIPQTSIRTVDEYMGRMKLINLSPVEAIPTTNEAIAAGKLENLDIFCLIHGKLRSNGAIDVTVRTPDMAFTENLLSHLVLQLR